MAFHQILDNSSNKYVFLVIRYIYCPYRVSRLVISTPSQIACICKELTFLISSFCPRCNLFRSTKSLLVKKEPLSENLNQSSNPAVNLNTYFASYTIRLRNKIQITFYTRYCIFCKIFKDFFLSF